MKLGTWSKRFFEACLLLVLLIGQFVQFSWHIVLGEEPIISTLDEFWPYMVLSIGIALGLLIYVHAYRTEKTWLFVVLLFQIPALIFWGLGLIDTLRYFRPIYLVLSRFTGIGVTIVVCTYSLWRIRQIKRDM